jgi:WD40 repeat protein
MRRSRLSFAQTGEYNLESGGISSIRFSPLGKFIAVSTSDGTFIIFETGRMEPLAEFPPVDGPINDVCWDSCVSSAYAATESGSVWHFVLFPALECDQVFISPAPLFSCACSPTSRLLALASVSGTLCVHDLDGECGTAEVLVQAHSAGIPSVAFSPDGATIVTVSHDSLMRIWLCPQLACIASFQVAPTPLEFVRYRPIGKTLLVLGGQKTVRLCLADRPIRRAFVIEARGESHLCAGGFLTVADPADTVVVAASDGTVAFFREGSTVPNGVIRVSDAEFVALDVHPSLPMFATGGGSDDMTLKMWVVTPIPEEEETPSTLAEKWDIGDRPEREEEGLPYEF